MGSGTVRIAVATAQETKGKGKAGNEKFASLYKKGQGMADSYPVKAAKKK